MRRHTTRANGFTLIELLVVIAITAVLIPLLPAVQRVGNAAELAHRWLGQLAENIVDYVDDDALADVVEWSAIFTDALREGEPPRLEVVAALLLAVQRHEDILSEFIGVVDPPPEGAGGAEEIRRLRLALLEARNDMRRLGNRMQLLLRVMTDARKFALSADPVPSH